MSWLPPRRSARSPSDSRRRRHGDRRDGGPSRPQRLQHAADTLQMRVLPRLVTPATLRERQEAVYRNQLSQQSSGFLQAYAPEASAHITLTLGQQRWLMMAGVLVVLLAVLGGGTFFIAAAGALITLYAAVVLFRIYVTVCGSRSIDTILVTPEEIVALTDFPVYTILCPLYREAGVLPQLVKACTELDYRAHKLDIKLLLEEDDRDTLDAVRRTDAAELRRGGGARRRPAHQAKGVQLRPAVRPWQVLCDFRRRGHPRSRPAEEGAGDLPAQHARHRLCAGQAQLLQPEPEHRDQVVRPRVHGLVRLLPAGPGGPRPARAAGRQLQPLSHRAAAWSRRLGSEQRDRGCRPGDAPASSRLPHRAHGIHHARGGEQRLRQLDAPTVAVGQGVLHQLAGVDASPGRAAPGRWGCAASRR